MNRGIIIETLKKCSGNKALNIYDQIALMDAIKYIEIREDMWERLKRFFELAGNIEALKEMKEIEDAYR